MNALGNDPLLWYVIVDAALSLSFKIMTAPQIKLETKILPLQSHALEILKAIISSPDISNENKILNQHLQSAKQTTRPSLKICKIWSGNSARFIVFPLKIIETLYFSLGQLRNKLMVGWEFPKNFVQSVLWIFGVNVIFRQYCNFWQFRVNTPIKRSTVLA